MQRDRESFLCSQQRGDFSPGLMLPPPLPNGIDMGLKNAVPSTPAASPVFTHDNQRSPDAFPSVKEQREGYD